jgi:UrcA family protein
MNTKIRSLIAASVATLAFAGTAFAAGAGELPTARVRYGDLNLSSDAGVATLYARLRHAADQVCEYSRFRVVDPACVTQAMDGAVAKVANGRLTALHLRRTGASRVAANGG